LPLLPPGSVLVLDNARFHHGARITDLVEAAGCSLLYLPPYSPDLNPIELVWSWIKTRVRTWAPRDDHHRLQSIALAHSLLPQMRHLTGSDTVEYCYRISFNTRF